MQPYHYNWGSRHIRLWFVLPAALTLVVSCTLPQIEPPHTTDHTWQSHDGLAVMATLDRTVLSEGDTLAVCVTVHNISHSRLVVPKAVGSHLFGQLFVIGKNEQVLRIDNDFVTWPDPTPSDFVSLRPDAKIVGQTRIKLLPRDQANGRPGLVLRTSCRKLFQVQDGESYEIVFYCEGYKRHFVSESAIRSWDNAFGDQPWIGELDVPAGVVTIQSVDDANRTNPSP